MLQLQHKLGFNPWPRNFHMLLVQQKKKKVKPEARGLFTCVV